MPEFEEKQLPPFSIRQVELTYSGFTYSRHTERRNTV